MKNNYLDSSKSLNIIEIFASVQGETSLTGLPTTFIRLAACNLRCTWCDTPYSFGKGKKVALQAIIDQAIANSCPHVCITGGEPLLQKNVHPLMTDLCDRGFLLSIETGGSLPIESIDPRTAVILDIKCPGSGMEARNYWPNLEKLKEIDEVKFVIMDRNDYGYALDRCRQFQLFSRQKKVLFSPVFDKLDPKELVKWMLEDKIPVRLNVQIHKYIWHPSTIGV